MSNSFNQPLNNNNNNIDNYHQNTPVKKMHKIIFVLHFISGRQ